MRNRYAGERTSRWVFALALAMLMARLISSAYTSGDDGYTYMAANSPQGWVSATWEMVVFQGRFYQLFVYPLAMLPFQFDSVLISNFFKVVTFLFFLSGFAFLVKQFFSRAQTIGCMALFLCVFETVGGSYNAFHGLPLWFGLVCGMILFSLGNHLRYVSESNSRAKSWSLFCFTWALLGYELILLYTPVFVFLSVYIKAGNSSFREIFSFSTIKKLANEHIWIILISLCYLITYVVFRMYYPGTYVGAQGFTVGSLEATLKPIWQFSVNSINLFDGIEGAKKPSITSFLFAIATSFLVVFSLMNRFSLNEERSPKPTWAKVFILAVVLIYVFVPNLLFGFTDRYRAWAAHGVPIYLGSLYSAVCLSILLYLILYFLVQVFIKFTGRKSPSLLILFALLLVSSYQNSKSSENFYRQSNMMSVRWDVASWVVDELNRSDLAKGIPIEICSRGFYKNTELKVYFRNPDLIADVKIYWDRYFIGHTGLNVSVVDIQGATDSVVENCLIFLEMSYFGNFAALELNGNRKVRALHDMKSIPNLVDFPNALLGL